MIIKPIISQQEKERQIMLLKEQIKTKMEQINNHNQKVRKLKLYKQMNVDFPIKNKYNSIIPLHCYTCWHTNVLPPLMKQNYDMLVQQNPEFTHHLFDENDCREFITENFDKEVLDAYNRLLPCAYKADLWRYCVLYINGGIYMDIKYKCANNFKLIALTEQEYFVRDRPKNMIYNALIVVKPENNIMLKCIHQIVKNVKTKFYGPSALSPTGPGLLGSFFTSEEIENMELYFTDVVLENNTCEDFMVYKNTIIFKYYDEYRNEQSKYQKNKYYSKLWDLRQIYN